MRKKASFFKGMGLASLVCGLALAGVLLGGCDNGDTGSALAPSGVYANFSNYPTGKVDANNGRLTIENKGENEVLLFISTAEPSNYIGTVGSLSSVKVKLPEEKFYTIVAVEKNNYEERTTQATQFNALTYYSNTQGYTIEVSPSGTYGGGTWIFNNNTDYWVQIKKTDLSENYAVIAPNALRVSIPVALHTPYDYYVYFSKELKYNGKVVALVEATDRSQANTAQVDDVTTPYTTTIRSIDAVSNSIKPAVMVKNNSNKSVRIYYTATLQKTNGSIGADFVIVGGKSEMISGFEIDDVTNSINFTANAWETPKYVPEAKSMQANKVYEITIPANEKESEITVIEVDASKYYN